MSDNRPYISVIVPCRNEASYVEELLRALLCQTYGEDNYEIIIVDGMSDDGTRKIVEQYIVRHSNIRLMDNARRITPVALNIGIRHARGEVIIRADAHTEYADDYVERCVKCLLETGADNVGGPALTRWRGYIQRVIAAAYGSMFSVGNASFHFHDIEGEVDTVTYGCWWRKKLIELGGFDEEFVKNQDDELNIRIRSRGGRVWLSPAIKSWYYPQARIMGLFRQYFRYGFWKYRVFQKHKQMRRLRHIIPSTFILALLFTGIAGSMGYFYAYGWRGNWWNTIILYIGFVFILYGISLYAIRHRYRTLLMIMHIVAGVVGVILVISGVFSLGIGVGKFSWLFVTCLYGIFLMIGALHIALSRGLALLPMLPLVIAVFHISYGLGFICGAAYWGCRGNKICACDTNS